MCRAAYISLCCLLSIATLLLEAQAQFRLNEFGDLQLNCQGVADWTLFADPFNCRKFHVCVSNTQESYQCAEQAHFDVTANHCVPGNCQQAASATTPSCYERELLAVPGQCQKFTHCRAGRRELHSCQAHQYFDSQVRLCQPIAGNPDARCHCGGADASNFTVFTAGEQNCGSFYTCVHGKAVLEHCPTGNYFDVTYQACRPDYNNACKDAETATRRQGLLANADARKSMDIKHKGSKSNEYGNGFVCATGFDEMQSEVGNSVFKPLPGDCKRFYVCKEGRPYVKACKYGFYFDAQAQYCRRGRASDICSEQQHEAGFFEIFPKPSTTNRPGSFFGTYSEPSTNNGPGSLFEANLKLGTTKRPGSLFGTYSEPSTTKRPGSLFETNFKPSATKRPGSLFGTNLKPSATKRPGSLFETYSEPATPPSLLPPSAAATPATFNFDF